MNSSSHHILIRICVHISHTPWSAVSVRAFHQTFSGRQDARGSACVCALFMCAFSPLYCVLFRLVWLAGVRFGSRDKRARACVRLYSGGFGCGFARRVTRVQHAPQHRRVFSEANLPVRKPYFTSIPYYCTHTIAICMQSTCNQSVSQCASSSRENPH